MSSQPTRVNAFASLEADDLADFAPKPVAATPAPVASIEAGAIHPVPTAPPEKTRTKAQVARAAADSGFHINNYVEKPRPARRAPAPDTFLKTVRLCVSDWNVFQDWCAENRYSHWEGFQILTKTLKGK